MTAMSRSVPPRTTPSVAPRDRPDGVVSGLVSCPECGLPAEIVDRWELDSTEGPLAHVKTLCVRRHWFLLPAEGLPVEP